MLDNDPNMYKELGRISATVEALHDNLSDLKNKNYEFEIYIKKELKQFEIKLEKNEIRWNRISGALIIVITLGSFITWLLSNFNGLKHLIE